MRPVFLLIYKIINNVSSFLKYISNVIDDTIRPTLSRSELCYTSPSCYSLDSGRPGSGRESSSNASSVISESGISPCISRVGLGVPPRSDNSSSMIDDSFDDIRRYVTLCYYISLSLGRAIPWRRWRRPTTVISGRKCIWRCNLYAWMTSRTSIERTSFS